MNPSVSLPALLSRLSRLPGDVEELMASLASMPRNWWMQSFPYPLVNIREEAEAFLVEAEVPGLKQDQIEVLIRRSTELTIQGERPAAPSEASWVQQERGTGRFQRMVTLPVPVNADKVEARLEHGILHLLLPKAETVKAHRIPVQGANGAL